MTTGHRSLTDSIGIKGLAIFAGLVREEYLTDLRDWRQAAKIYREMSDHVIIATLLDSIRTPLLATDTEVIPASDSEADQKAADFVFDNIMNLDRQTWRSHQADMLECLQFGFALAEVVMEKRDDGRLWLKNLEPRGQETIAMWDWEDDRPVVALQRDPITGASYTLPMDKLIHVTYRGRKGNPQGQPLLRSLFPAWLKLKYLENFEAIGIERDVGGMPVVDFPDPEKWQGPTSLDDLKSVFEDAFKNLRMDENMWLLMPPGSRAQSWGSGPRSYNIREAIQAKQREILMRFFAQFLMLEHAGLDASGLLKGSQDFFALGLKAVQEELLEAWNLQLVPLMFSVNSFPGMTDYPEIVWHDPGKVDVTELISGYVQATNSKLITPLREDEEHVRSLLDLPDLPEGVGEGPREPMAPSMPAFPFAEHPAGQRLRITPDKIDDFLNSYQRELVDSYDPWIADIRNTLVRGREEGWTAARMRQMVDGKLQDLESHLITLGRRRIYEAGTLGLGQRLGHHANAPGVQRLIAELQTRNDRYLSQSLIPYLRQSVLSHTEANLPAEQLRKALTTSLEGLRARVSSYTGGATVAVFEVQKRAGTDENAARRARGEKPFPIRWVLDPEAAHCQDDPRRGTFGCPTLARVYPGGWDELPTVPAGNVSCMANCRCHLEGDFGNGWERP